ncbi:cutinase [Mycolicibacterium rutilum]|uniref:Cutinase n=2 Tax=Mycolicibacterium rutilum TaxID=370526 RepID=A0A1H6J2H3_MYCRU|nr:cutinase [Mycolicibacterium rutilum]
MKYVGYLAGAASAVAVMAGSVIAATPSQAAPCPDVEVVFARGTFEAPGVGATGQAFVDALRAKTPGKSVDVYAVNYPASLDFATAADGVIDASNKVIATAANCPDTKVVLGGYSQGAAVAAYITEDAIPEGYVPPPGMTGPMPPSVADHVAAVALFGKPSSGFLQMIYTGAPPITVGSHYTGKTLDLCIPADPVCSPTGNDNGAHGAYLVNGMVDQAAQYAADRLPHGTGTGSGTDSVRQAAGQG